MVNIPDTCADRLSSLLDDIYPDHDRDDLIRRVSEAFWPLNTAMRQSGRDTDHDMWSERDALLISYGNSLVDGTHEPLHLLHAFLQAHMQDVVSAVHILPFFPYSSDDGFAVTDYRAVNPDLGDWPDINRIADDFTLMSDLVLNHVSAQGEWFQAYLAGQPPYDGFFFEASPADDLSAVVRPRTSPLLQQVETAQGTRHVWCTFSDDQVDLDFRNPEVLLEFLRIMRLHIDNGVRILRLDAVAFVWKEAGTPSIHLPQTHAIVKLMRLLCDYAEEPVVLLTETNVPNTENLSYFGDGDEAHAVYNFTLPPLILHAMMSGSAQYLRHWQASMPPAQPGCTYLNFTASHDGIGVRPVEGILPTLELARVVDAVRDLGGLVSMRRLSDGSETPYELNTSYFEAMGATFRGRDAFHVDRFLCAQTIPMSMEGIPAFYIHSMLATPNDHDGVARRDMNRAINRHQLDHPTLGALLEDPETVHAQVLHALSERLRLRADQSAFHPNATQYTLPLDDRVFGLWRQSTDRNQSIFALHNVSDQSFVLLLSDLNLIEGAAWRDLLSGDVVSADQTHVEFGPYQCRWITNR